MDDFGGFIVVAIIVSIFIAGFYGLYCVFNPSNFAVEVTHNAFIVESIKGWDSDQFLYKSTDEIGRASCRERV